MRSAIFIAVLLGWQAGAVTIDQIAITVGQHVITESQIDEELRVTALLNQVPPQYSAEQRKAAASRLIDQALIQDEIELTHYPAADAAAVNEALTRVQALYGSPQAFERALRDLQLDADDVRQHLAAQIAAVRFVGFRFRPDAGISDADIEGYYKREVEALQSKDPKQRVPDLATTRTEIRRSLIEERTDEALDDWLSQARKQTRIVFLDKTLEQPGNK